MRETGDSVPLAKEAITHWLSGGVGHEKACQRKIQLREEKTITKQASPRFFITNGFHRYLAWR